MENAHTQSWAKMAAAIVIGVGLVLAASAWPPLAAPVLVLVDLIIWPLDRTETLLASETRLFAAIAGGVMVGWGVTLWKMAEHVLPADLGAARSIALSGIYTWFAVDSLGSIAAGAWLNAVLNISFVVLFLYAFRQSPQHAATATSD